MNFIKTIYELLIMLLKILLFGWVKSFANVLKLIWAKILECRRRRKIPERERKVPDGKCVPIQRPEFHQPDPLIYAQFYLMSLGLAVTWDNPDIVLEQAGVPVSSSKLQPDTDYDVIARIWNNSTEAPVAGLPVQFSFLSFGIGTTNTAIGSTAVDLGVKGGPNHPAFARMKWHTPKKVGHYCIQVFLDWFDDANPNNNLGQENTQVGTAHSPADFTFNLRNATPEWHDFHFETDSYAIPALLPCPEQPMRAATRSTDDLAHHRRQAHPVPEGWSVEFNPSRPRLGPQEEVEIHARIAPPAGFLGTQPVNVNAFYQGSFVGGVTLYVTGV